MRWTWKTRMISLNRRKLTPSCLWRKERRSSRCSKICWPKKKGETIACTATRDQLDWHTMRSMKRARSSIHRRRMTTWHRLKRRDTESWWTRSCSTIWVNTSRSASRAKTLRWQSTRRSSLTSFSEEWSIKAKPSWSTSYSTARDSGQNNSSPWRTSNTSISTSSQFASRSTSSSQSSPSTSLSLRPAWSKIIHLYSSNSVQHLWLGAMRSTQTRKAVWWWRSFLIPLYNSFSTRSLSIFSSR